MALMPGSVLSSLQMLGCSLQTGCSRRDGTLSLLALRPLSFPQAPPADLGPVGEPAPHAEEEGGERAEGFRPAQCHGQVQTAESEVLGYA